MKHSLQLRLSQHLTLTPQLQLSIRLLQLSTQELDQEIERYLRDNPLLERDEAMSDMSERYDKSGMTAAQAGDVRVNDQAQATSSDDSTGAETDTDSDRSSGGDMLSEISYGSA